MAKYIRTGFSLFLSPIQDLILCLMKALSLKCVLREGLCIVVFLLIPFLEFIPFGGDGALLIASAVLDCYRALEQNCAARAFVLCEVTLHPCRMEGLTSLASLIHLELFSTPS